MIRSRIATCSLVMFACIIQSCAKSTDQSDPFPAEALQAVLDTELEEYNGIGISVSVLVPGQELWNGTSGISHSETPISPAMLFCIASITKTYTAACILDLAEEGALSLQDSVLTWLSSYPNIDSTITIRQLLNHTSGVYDYYQHPAFFDSMMADPDRVWTPEETLSFVLEPYFTPGMDWKYANTNYILLGMIIEEATSSSVASEFRTRFLSPLGLQETYLSVEEELNGIIAHGWTDIDDDSILDDVIESLPMTAFMSLEWTAGAMFSSSRDLARWTNALFNGQVIGQTLLDEMLSFYSFSIPGNAYSGYGLGIGRFSIAGQVCYGHGGELQGYRSAMAYIPEYNVSITVLMNEVNGACLWAVLEELVQTVIDYLS